MSDEPRDTLEPLGLGWELESDDENGADAPPPPGWDGPVQEPKLEPKPEQAPDVKPQRVEAEAAAAGRVEEQFAKQTTIEPEAPVVSDESLSSQGSSLGDFDFEAPDDIHLGPLMMHDFDASTSDPVDSHSIAAEPVEVEPELVEAVEVEAVEIEAAAEPTEESVEMEVDQSSVEPLGVDIAGPAAVEIEAGSGADSEEPPPAPPGFAASDAAEDEAESVPDASPQDNADETRVTAGRADYAPADSEAVDRSVAPVANELSAATAPPINGGGNGLSERNFDAWHWKFGKPSSQAIVLDYGGVFYGIRGRSASYMNDAAGMKGYFSYVADYEESTVSGILFLSTDIKYAKVLARKRLEELGDLTGDGVLHVYETVKREGGQVAVVYEILPKQRHSRILESYVDHPGGFYLHDCMSLLFGLFKKLGRGPKAAALRLGEAIHLVAGRDGKPLLCRRYTLLGDDSASFNEAIYALAQDLGALEKNIGKKFPKVVWVEAMTDNLNTPLPDIEITVETAPLIECSLDDRKIYTALPGVLEKVGLSYSLGPEVEKRLRPMELLEPALWLLLFAASIVALYGWHDASLRSAGLDSQIASVRSRMNDMQREQVELAVDREVRDIAPAMELVNGLYLAAVSPPFGELWNYLSGMRPEPVKVDGLEFDYGQDVVKVRLEGRVDLELILAQQLFTEFIRDLEAAGFAVVGKTLELNMEGNLFALDMTWPLLAAEQ